MKPKFPEKMRVQTQKRGETKRFAAVSFSAILCLCGVLSPVAHAQNVGEVVRAVNQAEAKIEYSATQIVQRGGSREVARIYRSGVKRRLDWLEPSIKRGDFLIDDGRNVWLYHRADNSAIQTKSAGRSRNLASQGWKLGASTREDGRLVRTLTRDNGRKVTVDGRTNAITATYFGTNATLLKSIDYHAVPDAKFKFSKPANATVTRLDGTLYNNLNVARRNASWLRIPAQIPVSYKLESAVVGEDEAWLRYTNGKQRFSIFEQRADAGEIKPQSVNGGWFWKRDGIRFMVTGAPANAITNMASSLK